MIQPVRPPSSWVFLRSVRLCVAEPLRFDTDSLEYGLEQQVVHDLHVQVFSCAPAIIYQLFIEAYGRDHVGVLNDTEHMQRILSRLEGSLRPG